MNSTYFELVQVLSRLTGKTLVSFHSRGDVEAVASSLALSKFLRRATVKSPDRLSGHARSVLKNLRVKEPSVLKKGESKFYDNVVLVDVANPKMLGNFEKEFEEFTGKKVVIDHHITKSKFKNSKVFEFLQRTSCCGVIYDVLKTAGFQVDKLTTSLLLCGVVVDSGNFQSANEHTFRSAVSLMHLSGLSYAEVKRIIERKVDFNEVRTIILNVSNAEAFEVNRETIIFCKCASFESATASVLLKTGADIIVCYNEKSGDLFVLKSNSSKTFAKLNAAKLLAKASSKFNGESGGHELIAGGKVSLTQVNSVVLFLKEELLFNFRRQVFS